MSNGPAPGRSQLGGDHEREGVVSDRPLDSSRPLPKAPANCMGDEMSLTRLAPSQRAITRAIYYAAVLASLAVFVPTQCSSHAMPSDPILVWVPSSAAAGATEAEGNLHYIGLGGRLLSVDPTRAMTLESCGGLRIAEPVERLHVALVEDGWRAQFEPPARVLVRSDHEVLLSCPAIPDAPRLTQASRESLRGFRQIVPVSPTPIRQPEESEPALEWTRTHDPFIQGLVDGLSQSNYVATWQALDDFESRYYGAPPNVQASQWILNQFASFGLQAEFHSFDYKGTRRNVVATHPGVVHPEMTVYICAHFDASSDTPIFCAPGRTTTHPAQQGR